jgi:hypothetical protein
VSEHRYLSTGCYHGGYEGHAYCRSMVGMNGEKRPARCKFCHAQCVCPCHKVADDQLQAWADDVVEVVSFGEEWRVPRSSGS